jgi:hypothetical protein
MKYLKEIYEETEFYSQDDEIINHKQKIVKVRKEHRCMMCMTMILPEENALRETGFMDGKPVSSYTCIDCCDEWLDKIEGSCSWAERSE